MIYIYMVHSERQLFLCYSKKYHLTPSNGAAFESKSFLLQLKCICINISSVILEFALLSGVWKYITLDYFAEKLYYY